MVMLSPAPIRKRYANASLRREGDGQNVLAGLPKKSERELSYAAGVLSSYKCRECSRCCSGGFSFAKNDPHYEEIMGGMRADRKQFVVRKEGSSLRGERVFMVFVPFGKKACGFLEGQEQAYSELHFAEPLSLEEGAVFGCKLYSTRPSICKSYPFVWDVFGEKHWIRGADNNFAALDPKCCAMWELAARGIGHFTLSEMIVLAAEAGEGENMLSSMGFCLGEITRRVGEGRRGKVFRNEEGEEVYPLNFKEITRSE